MPAAPPRSPTSPPGATTWPALRFTSRSSPVAGALFAVLLSGCEGCDPKLTWPVLVEPMSAEATGIYVGRAIGTGTISVPVYAVNGLGVPVPSGTIGLSGEGLAVDGDAVTPDASGWGTGAATASGPGAFSLSATAGALAGEGTVFATAARVGSFATAAYDLGAEPELLAAGDGQFVAAIGARVVAVDLASGGVAQIGAFPSPVLGLEALHVDRDGVLDLLAWSADAVVCYRGRGGGGYTLGTGFSPVGGTVVAANATDVDGDTFTDLLVLVDGPDASAVAWIEGDGAWAFAQVDGLQLDFHAAGVSAQDVDGNGEDEITVVTTDGLLRRFGRVDAQWASASSADYDVGMGSGVRVLPPVDLDRDGLEDLPMVGPRLDGAGMTAVVVSFGGSTGAVYGTIADTLGAQERVDLQVADMTGDGEVDLVLSLPTQILVESPKEGGGFSATAFEGPGSRGLAVVDPDRDGIYDLVTGATRARLLPGARVLDDPETVEVDEGIPWKPAATDAVAYNLGLEARPWAGNLDEDGVVDLVGIVTTLSGTPGLQAWLGVPEDGDTRETFASPGAVELVPAGTVLDLAVCGREAFAIVENGDARQVHELAILDDASLSPVDAYDAAGARLACGNFADADLVVVSDEGAAQFFLDGALVREDSLGSAVVGLAAGDRDGDGIDESVLGCGESACQVLLADFDGDGLDDLARSSAATGVTMEMSGGEFAGEPIAVAPAGIIAVADADGDGVADLLISGDGAVSIVRGLGGVPSVAVTRSLWRPVTDPPIVADLDGDGIPDGLWLAVDRDAGDAYDWSGQLLYAESE